MNTIVLIGASSEIAQESKKIFLQNNYDVYCVTSKKIKNIDKNILCVDDYLSELVEISNFISDIDNPIVIFFNGYLKENRPISKNPTSSEIQKTFIYNFKIPYAITKFLVRNSINVKSLFTFPH